MRILVSIVFNYKYIEPAIVTMGQLCRQQCLNRSCEFSFLYLPCEDESINSQVEGVVATFLQNPNNENVRYRRWIINLPRYERFHFDNSIIAKTLVPLAADDFDYVINFDAGFLLGGRFDEFFRFIEGKLLDSSKYWVVGAVASDDATEQIPEALRGLLLHNTYVSGAILLFNSDLYKRMNVAKLLRDNFHYLRDHLVYAEQELLSVSLAAECILRIPSRFMKTYQLGFSSADSGKLDNDYLNDSAVYKCSGSLKPWKYWVLDKKKSHWLNVSNQFLHENICIEYAIITEMRHSVDNELFRRRILEAYTDEILPP